MKTILIAIMVLASVRSRAQELYEFTEPASNMPAHSLSLKQTSNILRNATTNAVNNRQTTELMLGLNKNWMLHVATTFSNYYSDAFRWESVRTYAKYRFFASDGLYTHFRMAAFAEAAYSKNTSSYDELSLSGDQSGISAGLIATQLLHKLALSSTIGVIESLQNGRGKSPQTQPYQALSYSLSAGYLLLPRKYTNYDQTNVNLYMELLGQRSLDMGRYYVDLAPAVQFIFNSEAKLNAGYRYQISGDMNRMSNSSWLISFEWLWLNALKGGHKSH